MIRREGAKLTAALTGIGDEVFLTAAAEFRAADDPNPLLPVILQVDSSRPTAGEDWPEFKERVLQQLGAAEDELNQHVQPASVQTLVSGNSLATALTREQYAIVAEMPGITVEYADLDNIEYVTTMVDVPRELGLDDFCAPSSLTGAGVTVAVLDSGVTPRTPP